MIYVNCIFIQKYLTTKKIVAIIHFSIEDAVIN